MDKYESLDRLISNENVIKVLKSAMLPNEDSLLAEVLEKTKDKFVLKIYVTSKVENKITYLAEIIRKKNKLGIDNWYVEFEGNWKIDNF